MRNPLPWLVLLASPLAGGCGTLASMCDLCVEHAQGPMGDGVLTSEGKQLVADMSPVYGGVQLDCRFVREQYVKEVQGADTLADRLDFAGRNAPSLLLVALDLPLSAALDTVLLPVTLYQHFGAQPPAGAAAEPPVIMELSTPVQQAPGAGHENP